MSEKMEKKCALILIYCCLQAYDLAHVWMGRADVPIVAGAKWVLCINNKNVMSNLKWKVLQHMHANLVMFPRLSSVL
jgi:hypothetical protein